jgi:hypothetical protein
MFTSLHLSHFISGISACGIKHELFSSCIGTFHDWTDFSYVVKFLAWA